MSTPVQITSRKEITRCASRRETARRDSLKKLSARDLLKRLEGLRGTEREVQLNILYHLNEVEHRRLYLSMAYGSLFEFCMEYLGYSKSSAGRRIRAARCIDRFPGAAGLFRSGELNLCALSMISGILTEENAGEILVWIRRRPFRDVEMLVARHRPGQIIRDRVKPVFVMNPDTSRGDLNTPACMHAQSGRDPANAGLNVEPKCKASFTFTPRHNDFRKKEADLRFFPRVSL